MSNKQLPYHTILCVSREATQPDHVVMQFDVNEMAENVIFCGKLNISSN